MSSRTQIVPNSSAWGHTSEKPRYEIMPSFNARVLPGVWDQQEDAILHDGLAIEPRVQIVLFALLVRVAFRRTGHEHLDLRWVHLHEQAGRNPNDSCHYVYDLVPLRQHFVRNVGLVRHT